MDSSLYALVEDLRGVDAAQVLSHGVSALTVGAAYHRARDVTPHGRTRVTLRHDGIHFPPGDLFDGLRLRPPVQRDADQEPLKALRRQTRELGVPLHGWGVFLHNTTLGLAFPDVTQENCFGDRAAPADLCPSNPDVRAYAVALGRAIARQGVDSVVSESLHFGMFGHGYHHERAFVELGPAAEFALGLCFCSHCQSRLPGAETARAAASRLAASVLDGGPPATELPTVLEDYARSRTPIVTSLAADVAEAVAAEGSSLTFLDLTGAVKGYADGRPTGGPAADSAWQIGVDPAAVSDVVPSYAILCYAYDEDRVAEDVTAYRTALGPDTTLSAVLRPGLPDTTSTDHLAAKVTAARKAGANTVDYYSYGLVPLPVLSRIPH
ncbi:hypothetical protein BZB76_0987 [Actinomadura pelletieri DSM 43383]|uniref:Alanine-rich protein n=1 Tax=Actinomadura pelletieri DSM 43383 TaxID=1120940 RepID=A0A495R082_9ACTN|nr:hypothetical protein [Actinomadura pelletieri]RKS79516.1 hypothetical protein BZB76_0987 [Actinomadura pelletieri DSM 43383]